MRTQLIAAGAAVVAAAALATTPVVSEAAGQITGKQIKNGSVTGKDLKDDSVTGSDVNESSLGQVPSAAAAGSAATAATAARATQADGLSRLPSGQTQSGAFSAATNGPAGGFLGFDITYPRALATAVANSRIVDTVATPDPLNCPGAGQAKPGYLCLYFQYHQGVGTVYGYSTSAPYNAPALGGSVGVGLYAPVTTATNAYVNGVWTVGAP